MHFQRFAPSASLQPHVQFFWTLESISDVQSFHTIPDGCPGLVFQQPVGAPIREHTGKAWPTLLLHGQTTRPAEMYPSGAFRLVGACLHPSAIPTLFQLPSAELTDTCLDVEVLSTTNRSCSQQLQEEATVSGQLHQLSSFLLRSLHVGHQHPDAAIAHAVATLVTAQGQVSLSRLQAAAGLSERSFQRRFKQAVGVTPQLFARICRFQASLHQLRTASYEQLSDVAYDHQYADQSHHIRTFREFTGISPCHYRQQVRPELRDFSALL